MPKFRKKVLVINPGIVGTEAAKVSAFRGHHVDIYDKGDNF